MSYRNRFKDIMFEFMRLLNKKGYMKDKITIQEIYEAIDEMMEMPGVNTVAHEYLCLKCKEENERR